MRRECEASLRRLRVDTIDLYQIHWPEPDEDIEEGWSALAKLKEEGKLRWIGVSNFNARQMERCRGDRAHHVAAAALLGIIAGSEQEMLPYCQEHGIGVIVYSPMKSGLLTGKMTRERVADFPRMISAKAVNSGAALSRNLALAELMKDRRAAWALGGRSGDRMDAAASGGDGRIVGMRSRNRPKKFWAQWNFGSLRKRLPKSASPDRLAVVGQVARKRQTTKTDRLAHVG